MESIPFILAGTAAGGSIIKGFSEASAQREQAKISNEQAARERARALVEADEQRLKASRIAGRDRAARGASGVDPGSGSPLAVDVATIGEGEFNAQQVMNEGALRAYRLEQEASTRKRAASNSIVSGFINAGTTALTAYSAYRNLLPAAAPAKTATGLIGTGYKVPGTWRR